MDALIDFVKGRNGVTPLEAEGGAEGDAEVAEGGSGGEVSQVVDDVDAKGEDAAEEEAAEEVEVSNVADGESHEDSARFAEFRTSIDRAVRCLQDSSTLVLGKSGIHGVGVFTSKTMVAGSSTWAPLPGVLRLTEDMMSNFPTEIRETLVSRFMSSTVLPLHGTHVVGLVSYLNHAKEANARLESGRLIFTKSVRSGAEVTINYAETPGWEHLVPRRRGKKKR